MSDDETDSRTASVGQLRAVPALSGNKALKNSQSSARTGVQDFVPQGARFTSTPLPIDSEKSSNVSDSGASVGDDQPRSNMSKRRKTNAPAISWNQPSRSAIRITLGAKPTNADPRVQQAKSAFDAVNDRYFRSRSASASDNDAVNQKDVRTADDTSDAETESQSYFVDDSDVSDDAGDSEDDDSMMVNIRQNHGLDGAQDHANGLSKPPHLGDISVDSHSTRVDQQNTIENISVLSYPSVSQLPPQSKAEAFTEFAATYSTTPTILADLKMNDLKIQARFFYYNSKIDELDLTRPISCTECLQQGHLSAVCPTKECENCGAWNLHEDRLCPSVRRCQRCRQVGHDAPSCPSSLKASAAETPCDYCGSDTHLELDCDKLWKFPCLRPLEGPIKVSISCSYCTNQNHLFGDCPLKKVPTTSSTFSLKEYKPSVITNLNSVLGPKKATESGMNIRGRAGNSRDAPPPDNDDNLMLHGKRSQIGTRGGRGKISIRGGIGQNRGLDGHQPASLPPPPPGLPPLPNEPVPAFKPRDYRDRNGDGNVQRRRSRSPAYNYRPPTGGFTAGKSGHPPASSRSGRGGGGRGRGRGRGGDQYRPGRR